MLFFFQEKPFSIGHLFNTTLFVKKINIYIYIFATTLLNQLQLISSLLEWTFLHPVHTLQHADVCENSSPQTQL